MWGFAAFMMISQMKIDELMPSYAVRAQYDIVVRKPLADTVAAFERSDFSRMPLTTILMTLRTLGRKRPSAAVGTQIEKLRQFGFIDLAIIPQQEIVLGVVGRFWQFESGILKGLTAEDLLHFKEAGYAKALWNFAFTAESDARTRVSTETRIQTFGDSATRNFRRYWRLVGPFSGLIRKEMLRLIKRNAERNN